MALGLVVLLLASYGSELFLSRVSLVILLAGVVLCFGGRQFLKELRFPCWSCCWPFRFRPSSSTRSPFPLQILASKLASDLLPLFGVPVLREGNVIELPAMKLEVAEACSGIRSLMSLFTLAVFYGYFLEKSNLAANSARAGQHSDRDCGQRGAHSRHRDCASNIGTRTRLWAFFTSFPAGSSSWFRLRACISSIAR
jgi:hypothetical protein